MVDAARLQPSGEDAQVRGEMAEAIPQSNSATREARMDVIAATELRKQRVGRTTMLARSDAGRGQAARTDGRASSRGYGALGAAAFDSLELAQVVLDGDDTLVLATALARHMFGLVAADFGRPLSELELFSRPVELNRYFGLPPGERRSIQLNGAHWDNRATERMLDVRIEPLGRRGVGSGTSISYRDVTERFLLEHQLADTRRDLGKTFDQLRSAAEQLEINLEALRGAGEQLDVAHEQLLSAPVLLERANDQLESKQRDLGRLNQELTHRTQELLLRNALVAAILMTPGGPAVANNGRKTGPNHGAWLSNGSSANGRRSRRSRRQASG